MRAESSGHEEARRLPLPHLAAALLLITCAAGCGLKVLNRGDGGNENKPVVMGGKPCRYRDYPGTVTVKEVLAPAQQGDDELVTVEFDADSAAAAPKPVQHFSKRVSLAREQAEKMGLVAGKKYHVAASYIESGTCAPGPDLPQPEGWD
jgi:hypothetical protein